MKGHSDWIISVCFSPDGTKIVSVGADSSIKVWLYDEDKVKE